MPINVDPTNVQPVTRLTFDPAAKPAPGVRQQLNAALDLDNVAVNVDRGAFETPELTTDPDFKLSDHLTDAEKLVAGNFGGVRSVPELNFVRKTIERERNAREVLAKGPLNELLATTFAVVADPTSYIPFLGAAGKVKGAARIARVGGIAAGEVALTEAALQSLQETRTIEESLISVGLGGMFGLTIGAAGVGITAARGGRDINAINSMLREATEDTAAIARAEFPDSGSAGAMSVPHIDPADTELASAFGLEKALAKLGKIGLASPGLETLASPFRSAREFALRLSDIGLVTKGNLRGVANPQAVETKIKRHTAVLYDFNRGANDAYGVHREAGGRLAKSEFFEEVGKAMRRGDESEVPGVTAAAQSTRRIYNLYKDRAVANGLLPEDVDVKTAASYFTRVYRKDRIRANLPVFKERIVAYLNRQLEGKDVDDLMRQELPEIADDIINTILGSPSGRTTQLKVPRGRGPLKERTFDIPDADIEDFLESDVQRVTNRYVRTLAADIEFQETFGTLDPAADIKERIRAEAQELASAAGTAKERTRIQQQGERIESLMDAWINQVRGTVAIPSDVRFAGAKQGFRGLRNLNFARLLGGVMLSSIPDVGRVVMQEGLARSTGTMLAEMGRGFKGIRLATREAQRAGTALDLYLSTRVRNMFDLSERFEAETAMEKFEKGTQTVANLAAQATLINGWNTALKGVTSMLASSRILATARKVARGEKLTKFEQRALAESGISPDLAARMADEAKHWDEVGEGAGSVLIANVDDWADAEARNVYLNALLRDVDNTIITPGAADAPLWTSTEWGKTLFQFKKFAAASTQRILLTGLQRRDMATLNGILLMVGLGGLSTAVRDLTAKGETRDRTPAQWAADSMDRSGVAALFFEGDALIEKFAGAGPVSALTGQDVSRFAGRDLLSQALGPTAGMIGDAATAAAGILKDDVTKSDIHKLRRLAPFQNVFYARWLVDQMEEGISRSFGLRDTASKQRFAPPSVAR